MQIDPNDLPDDMPDFLRHIIGHAAKHQNDDAIDPTLEVIPKATGVDHPIGSRVTLTPEFKGRYKFPKEPDYGVMLYKYNRDQMSTPKHSITSSIDFWDCIVAIRTGGEISLYAFHTSQLRIPKPDNIDIDIELDNYKLPLGRQFIPGDKICRDPENPQNENKRFADYPRYAIVDDVFPGITYMGESAASEMRPIDMCYRCVVNSSGTCASFYGFSGQFKLYSEMSTND